MSLIMTSNAASDAREPLGFFHSAKARITYAIERTSPESATV
jgi:hypothetical protein